MASKGTVLITGATGFVGSHLLRHLVRLGWTVRGLKRSSSDKALVADVADRVQWAVADINDLGALEDAFEGVDMVCHCAAIVSFHAKDAALMHKVNVEGTANVVNLALYGSIKHLVHLSSIAALGRSDKRTHLDENCKWEESKYNSRYAQSKFQAEMEVHRGIAEGLPASIVNPSVVIGSQHWDRGVAAFFKKMDEGWMFCPSGSSGFVDVQDVAKFIGLLLENGPTRDRCILNGTNCSYRALFAEIARNLNVPEPPITVGPFLAELAWRVEWLREKILGAVPLVTRESARAGVSHFSYANEKSHSMFGFEYTPISETIRRTTEEYRRDNARLTTPYLG